MVYSNNDDFALKNNFDNWDAFDDFMEFPSKRKLEADRQAANAIINETIGTEDTDITTHLKYLKQLEVEMIMRMQDKGAERLTSEGRSIYMPHDYLYEHERTRLRSFGAEVGVQHRGVG